MSQAQQRRPSVKMLDFFSIKRKIENIKNLNNEQLVSLLEEISSFRDVHRINDDTFLPSSIKQNEEELSFIKSTHKLFNTAECYIHYFLHVNKKREEKRKEILEKVCLTDIPLVKPKIWSNGNSYKFYGNMDKFNYLRLRDLGLFPNESLTVHAGGR